MIALGEVEQLRDAPAPAAAAALTRRGFVAFAGRTLLLAVVPLSLIWFPLGNVPGAGNLTSSDAALIALWAVTGWDLLLRGTSGLDVGSPSIVLLAVLIGVLAGVGSELSTSGGKGLLEFSLSMKRFGLASVLPLAARLFGSQRMGAWMRAVSLATISALATFTLVPELQAYLPSAAVWDPELIGERATGLLTNPNDLAYAAVGLAILHGALVPRKPRTADRALLVAGLAGSAICLIASASRSGLLGAAGALIFVVLFSTIRVRTKLALTACAAALVIAGLSQSAVFQDRVTQMYSQGASDESISSRLEAQWLAVRASIVHPLGVGFTSFAEATSALRKNIKLEGSDSIYFDTLLGSGFLGLLCLLWLFRVAWKYVERGAGTDDRRARILKSGIVAFLLFGTAAVIPFSVFLSPLFFSMVAVASYPHSREAREH